MAALAICAVTAALLRDRTATATALISRPRPPGHAGHWTDWKRRYQAHSRWYHQRTRPARDAGIALVSHRTAARSSSYHRAPCRQSQMSSPDTSTGTDTGRT
jgi:hypothetical protein